MMLLKKRKRLDKEEQVKAKIAYINTINPLLQAAVSIPSLQVSSLTLPDNSVSNAKLHTITAQNKVSNSATTTTATNTASAIVARDSSGNFSTGTITVNLVGNVASVSDLIPLNLSTSSASSTQIGNATSGISVTGTNINLNGNITMADSKTLITNTVNGKDGLLQLEASSIQVYGMTMAVNSTNFRTNSITPLQTQVLQD